MLGHGREITHGELWIAFAAGRSWRPDTRRAWLEQAPEASAGRNGRDSAAPPSAARVCCRVAAAAMLLADRALAGAASHRRLPLAILDELTIDARLALGDQEAIYDAIREAQCELEEAAEQIDQHLSGGRHLAALQQATARQDARRKDAARNGAAEEPH